MKNFRQSNIAAAFVALFSVLFMQFAVATYTCPTLKTGPSSYAIGMTAEESAHGMAGCHGVDLENANLCQAESQKVKISLDKPDLPNVPVFAVAQLQTEVMPLVLLTPSDSALSKAELLTRATSPSLSIRHCCFRI